LKHFQFQALDIKVVSLIYDLLAKCFVFAQRDIVVLTFAVIDYLAHIVTTLGLAPCVAFLGH
jgi:hypothetical protein